MDCRAPQNERRGEYNGNYRSVERGSDLIDRSTKLRTTILLSPGVVWYESCLDNTITDDSEWCAPTTEGLRAEREGEETSSSIYRVGVRAYVERTLQATPVEWLHRPPVPLPASHYCTSRG